MQEKLHVSHCRNRRKAAIGIYPLDKISWPVRFESRSPSEISFMPLEASREMTATQILSAHPTGKQYAHLLEGEKSYPVFVDSSDQILSMPPIINSALTGRVTEDTKDVFVECSGFDQQFLDNLLSIIVCALVDEGGQVKTVEVAYSSGSYSTPVLKPTTMPISIAYINRLLGLSLNETEIKRLLSRTGLGYSAKKAIIPPYRVDILHQIDLVEEVLIAYGLDNINPEHNEAATIGGENPLMVFRQRVADLIAGLGLVETSTYHLDSEVNQTVRSGSSLPVVKLENPRTSEYNCLRAWITPSLLEVFRTNKHRDYPQRIFCCGTIFSPDKSAECGVAEKQSIAIATSHVRVDFTETRQLAEALFCALGIEASWVENENGWAIPGRCASAKIGNREVAVIGEIHPKVLSEWQLEMPVSVLEIDLESLFAAVSSR